VEQYTEKHYDDDLTVVADEYNDSFQTDTVDLFEFPSYDESPIARLKSLVLSIDWEITDDVLRQFNEELVDLKDIWADEKIYLVYVQALEKISKYIYQEKADSNPNAIKLLLTFYYNLEKIISSEAMPEEEKRQILLEDVKKFELLKKQIGRAQKTAKTAAEDVHDDEPLPRGAGQDPHSILFDLKAIVLGIDWEITEKDLEKLRNEVVRLEEVFAASRPKLIFLQGLGTLAAYIRLKKSNAHADAFKLLHSFFAGLEKIVTLPMSLEEEKAVLFPEVEKFNAFKTIIGSTISPEAIQADDEVDEYDEEYELDGGLAPALSDLPEEEVRGFQEEEEAAALGLSSTFNVSSQIDRFFSETPEIDQLSADEERILLGKKEERNEFRDAAEAQFDSLFPADGTEERVDSVPHVDQEIALRGVDVETEADDDSDEAELPLEAGQLAPALVALDDDIPGGRKAVERNIAQADLAGDLENRLDDFFGEEVFEEKTEHPPAFDLSDDEVELRDEVQEVALVGDLDIPERDYALQGVDVESEDDEEPEEALSFAEGASIADSGWEMQEREAEAEGVPFPDEPAPALFSEIEEEVAVAELSVDQGASETSIEERLDSFFDFEEEKEAPALATQEISLEEEMSTGEPEYAAEETEEEAEKTEELSSAAAFLETAQAEPVAVASLFEMEVLEETPLPDTVARIFDTPEAIEEEVVFELAEEDDEITAVPHVEDDFVASQVLPHEISEPVGDIEIAGESDLTSLVPEAAEITEDVVPMIPSMLESPAQEDLLDTDERILEGAQVIAPQEILMEDVVAAPVVAVAEVAEFSAVFEEVDEAVVEDVLPESALAKEMQAQEEPSVIEEREELAAPVDPVDTESSEDRDSFVEEEFVLPASDEDPLVDLRACVSSVGLELEDSIFQGLYTEINRLRSRWVSSPLEKSFLQLLSTIAQHIDQYRYESSSEAFGLLQSVINTFAEALDMRNDPASQEILLSEMTKVLLWQQTMLNRQAVMKGDALTFTDPVRFQEGESLADEQISFIEEDSQDEFSAVFEGVDEEKISEEELTAMEEESLLAETAHPSASAVESVDDVQVLDEPLFVAEDLGGEDAGSEQLPPVAEEEMHFDQDQVADREGDDTENDTKGAQSLYSDLEAELAAERAYPTAEPDADEALARQIRAMIQSEFDLIRQELQNEVDALRNELKKRED
jgi:pilus assembly protein FimV